MCNMCQKWFNCHCLGIDVSLSKYANKFVCPRCVDNFFTGFCRYLSYHVTESLKITNQNDVSRLYDVWSEENTDTRLCIINELIKGKICIERHFSHKRNIKFFLKLLVQCHFASCMWYAVLRNIPQKFL